MILLFMGHVVDARDALNVLSRHLARGVRPIGSLLAQPARTPERRV